MSTQSVLVSEWADPDENEGDWPYPTQHREFRISGDLADQIRARAGRDGDVSIVEEVQSGGYSEYTQETYYEFEVRIGAFKVFEPYVSWHDSPDDVVPKTVFEQLNNWLGQARESAGS